METGQKSNWGYGQVLSLVLLVVPIQEVLSALATVDPRDQGMYTELLKHVSNVYGEWSEEDVNRMLEYIQKGADINFRFRTLGGMCSSCAFHCGHTACRSQNLSP